MRSVIAFRPASYLSTQSSILFPFTDQVLKVRISTMTYSTMLYVAVLAVICPIVYIFYIGYQRRAHVNELRKQGIVSMLFSGANPSNERVGYCPWLELVDWTSSGSETPPG
jgi:hypothetical protein